MTTLCDCLYASSITPMAYRLRCVALGVTIKRRLRPLRLALSALRNASLWRHLLDRSFRLGSSGRHCRHRPAVHQKLIAILYGRNPAGGAAVSRPGRAGFWVTVLRDGDALLDNSLRTHLRRALLASSMTINISSRQSVFCLTFKTFAVSLVARASACACSFFSLASICSSVAIWTPCRNSECLHYAICIAARA